MADEELVVELCRDACVLEGLLQIIDCDSGLRRALQVNVLLVPVRTSIAPMRLFHSRTVHGFTDLVSIDCLTAG